MWSPRRDYQFELSAASRAKIGTESIDMAGSAPLIKGLALSVSMFLFYGPSRDTQAGLKILLAFRGADGLAKQSVEEMKRIFLSKSKP